MSVLIAIVAFVFTLGVIVFIHESGHYMVAKLFGVRVLTFSLGFGNRVWGFTRGGTDYRISALPIGGYVRMGGEMAEESTGDPRDFVNKPRWQRILIYLAGPFMNVVLSVSVIAVLFMIGINVQGFQDVAPVVGGFDTRLGGASAGEKAGLEVGDRILSVDGKPIELWRDFEFAVSTAPEKALQLEVQRQDQRLPLVLTPSKVERYEFGDAGIYPKMQLRLSIITEGKPAAKAGFLSGDAILKVDGQPIADGAQFVAAIESKAGKTVEIEVLRQDQTLTLPVVPEEVDGKGRIGVQLGFFRQLPFFEAFTESINYNIEIVSKTFQVIGKIIGRSISFKSATSGPLEMAVMTGQAAEQGMDSLFFFMGFLSISIGILNLLPIPLLDGGQILILLVESVLRRDLSLVVKERFAQAGFMMLMVLMATVFFFDLSKNLPSLFPK